MLSKFWLLVSPASLVCVRHLFILCPCPLLRLLKIIIFGEEYNYETSHNAIPPASYYIFPLTSK
jgi:hypothetical protein